MECVVFMSQYFMLVQNFTSLWNKQHFTEMPAPLLGQVQTILLSLGQTKQLQLKYICFTMCDSPSSFLHFTCCLLTTSRGCLVLKLYYRSYLHPEFTWKQLLRASFYRFRFTVYQNKRKMFTKKKSNASPYPLVHTIFLYGPIYFNVYAS